MFTADVLPKLDTSTLDLIHIKSVELLETVGFRFARSDRALGIFRRHGFKTDGDVVFFDEKRVRSALSLVPSRFRVRALNPDNDFILGDGSQVFSNCAAPAFTLGPDGTRRLATKEDYIKFLKVVDQLDAVSLVRPMWDVGEKPDGKFAWIIRWALEYTEKAISGSSNTDISLVAAAFGLKKKQMREAAAEGFTCLLGVCNPRSPLTLEKGNCDFCIDQAEWGVGCKISPVPIAGMTGPITLEGLLILQNAEVLAPLVLSQLVNPGTPVVYGVLSTTTDLRTMVTTAAPPELTGRIMRTGIQMADYYGIPSRVDVGNTNSCVPDYQAGAESTLMIASAMWSGADLMASLGSLESRGIGTLEKLILDAETAEAMKAFLAAGDMSETGIVFPEEVKTDPVEKIDELLESYVKPDRLSSADLQALDRIVEESKE
jgi:trimethylamine---corrinoid protein Co-methyltransferase